jgi:hypothetical protein
MMCCGSWRAVPIRKISGQCNTGGRLGRGNEMRILVALFAVLAVLYFWDAIYNNGMFSDGAIRMEQSMLHHMGH